MREISESQHLKMVQYDQGFLFPAVHGFGFMVHWFYAVCPRFACRTHLSGSIFPHSRTMSWRQGVLYATIPDKGG